ncbi:MAG: hypothetical protein ACRDS0_18815 [Pseudonocardiaceae bacterium]
MLATSASLRPRSASSKARPKWAAAPRGLAGVERGPPGQIVQVGDGDVEPIRDQVGGITAEYPQTPGQVVNHGVVAGTAAVLVVQGAEGQARVLYPLDIGHTDTSRSQRWRRTG